MGSPGYMSPEQLRSTRDVDARSDIWALGVILYELTSGRQPFVAESITELALKVAMDPLPPLYLAGATGRLRRGGRALPREGSRGRATPTSPSWRSALVPFGPPHAGEAAERIARVLRVPLPAPAGAVAAATVRAPTTGGPATGPYGQPTTLSSAAGQTSMSSGKKRTGLLDRRRRRGGRGGGRGRRGRERRQGRAGVGLGRGLAQRPGGAGAGRERDRPDGGPRRRIGSGRDRGRRGGDAAGPRFRLGGAGGGARGLRVVGGRRRDRARGRRGLRLGDGASGGRGLRLGDDARRGLRLRASGSGSAPAPAPARLRLGEGRDPRPGPPIHHHGHQARRTTPHTPTKPGQVPAAVGLRQQRLLQQPLLSTAAGDPRAAAGARAREPCILGTP